MTAREPRPQRTVRLAGDTAAHSPHCAFHRSGVTASCNCTVGLRSPELSGGGGLDHRRADDGEKVAAVVRWQDEAWDHYEDLANAVGTISWEDLRNTAATAASPARCRGPRVEAFLLGAIVALCCVAAAYVLLV